MDAFEVHRRLIADYRDFTEGFFKVRDPRVAEVVARESERGSQWPDPWLSLNPSFASGGRIDDLVTAGLLDPECDRIFRVKSGPDDLGTTPLTLHLHQREAIEVAARRESYVLTTGTGSGKSLAYIVPIVDRVLKRGTAVGASKAIVVYPMNALANSQMEELGKFLENGYGGRPPVTFARYTGQEKPERRQQILANPPDILLTNYVMLELVLTRPDERSSLVKAAKGLQFLVLDELHTYRGRQGADVAMLVRRVREACEAQDSLVCVGTSATMSSGGTVAQQRQDVAAVATRIFGAPVSPGNVITETLVRATSDRNPSDVALADAVRARGDAEAIDPDLRAGYAHLTGDPLASWIEDTFGVTEEQESGRLIRRPPTTVDRAAVDLSEQTGTPVTAATTAIRATLLAGSRTKDEKGRSLFAFRLHQFISKGGSVYATAEPSGTREIVTDYQVVLPGSPERRLYPLAFCRECGQEYLLATRTEDMDGIGYLEARHGMSRLVDQDGRTDGYLYVSDADPWPSDPLAESRLPSSWWVETPTGPKVVTARRKNLPVRVLVGPDGRLAEETATAEGTLGAWIPGDFKFCLSCGVSYESIRSAELAKLATLDKEGRSSAMTVLASSIVTSLRTFDESELDPEARKLLTFVDNRQDASLQAGHLNDFVQVAQLRGAIYRAALAADPEFGLETVDFGSAIFKTLGASPQDYAQDPDSLDQRNPSRAMRGVLEYRALMDLRKGWRVTLPNLEQVGLIQVRYPLVPRLAELDAEWADAHSRLRDATAGQREEIIRVCLDEFRRVLAIESDALSPESFERLRRLSRDQLTGVWELPIGEPDPELGTVILTSKSPSAPRFVTSLTARGAFGRWLRLPARFGEKLNTVEGDEVIDSLIGILAKHGLVTQVRDRGVVGWRLNAGALTLFPGDGEKGSGDPVRRSFEAEESPRVVPFFRDLYRDASVDLAGLHALEHTAQVPAAEREDRESRFRAGTLPLLFCSPTMELGVDISSLNAVAMRNVPPTPANYAQRSGRAGRSGQQAIVVTYCSSGNAHDTYYFNRSNLMVAGQVQPPRLDLANADLVRSHVHAVWLAEVLAGTHHGLGRSLSEVLDLTEPGMPVRADLADLMADPDAAWRATATADRLLSGLAADLDEASWWTQDWTAGVISSAPASFDAACQRWRELYTLAADEKNAAHALNSDTTASPKQREEARRRYQEASRRVELLLNESDAAGQSDFYTYRYLASEGFLPGYSFPRLPLSAFIPGSRGKDSAWLQRARFLAISEFGPGALIYHEGSTYQVSRIALPRRSEGAAAGEVIRTDARVCSGCGYHHPRQVGVDICENCGATLAEVWHDMLQLQQVVTRPRQRISADEEERNRVGFELRTTYRFTGEHAHSRADAVVRDDSDRDVLEVTYGDAAEIRVANLGRRGRANKDLRGFNLDLIKGRWLSENPRPDEEPDDDLEANQADVQVKARVTPFVEDRRNIAVLRWIDPVDEVTAVTAQYALERGLEATFQLEDSELASETAARQRQPRADPADRGRRGRCRGAATPGHRT